MTLQKIYPWLKVLPTKNVTRPAEKRDIGVARANGQIIAFIDDDAYPDKQWLAKAVSLFHKEKVEAVVGPGILPENAGFWEQVFDEVLKTGVGAGGYSYRFIKGHTRYVDDYPSMNFLIKKDIFQELGGFNSEYWPGEDSKLCNDLVHKMGKKILYHPDVTVHHHRRTTLNGYLKQHANYGYHRGAFFAHGDKNSRLFVYLVPTLFVLYLGVALISILLYFLNTLSFFSLQLVLFPLAMYGAIAVILILQALLNTRSLRVALTSVFVLILTHITYGIMFVKGFFKGRFKNKNIYDK